MSAVQQIFLTRYETRKVIFRGDNLAQGKGRDAIVAAGRFELLWLENKQAYYHSIAAEDEKRLQMRRTRFA